MHAHLIKYKISGKWFFNEYNFKLTDILKMRRVSSPWKNRDT